jgi:TolB-like protein/DNA-binding winged helix-turn-helix (wHTH) protein/Tfp pilus assembly protein PilF
VNDVPPTHAPIHFGVFELDTESGELRKQGVKIRLQEQPFQILQVLLEHPGRIVTREELKQRIWPSDTFVDFDRGLYNAIKKLREALGDSANTPRFIETLSRRGYRFIATVNGNGTGKVTETLSSAATRPGPSWNLRIGVALGTGIIVVIAAALGAKRFSPRSAGSSAAPQIRSIAVLPLQSLSADPAEEYFSDGMTDALITDLAKIGSIKVISRTSSMQYKQTKKTLPEIARELNVDGIVEGTVQRSGDRVRITAQLIQGPTDKHLWASSYEQDVRDVFALERNLTEDIARQIQARLISPERPPLEQPKPVNPKVLEAYLQGNYHLSRYGEGSGQEETEQASKYFQEAIDGDPNFAPAYVGMAMAHDSLLLGSVEDAAITRRAAERAVELNPDYSDARRELGLVKWQPNLDWRGAEGEFRHAIALNPNNADARYQLGLLLIVMGRVNEGLQECKLAQQLNPNSDESSMCFFHARDYDTSMALQKLMLQKDPRNGYLHCFLFNNYFKKGMQKEAVEEIAACVRLFGVSDGATKIEHELAVSGPRAAIQVYAKGLEDAQAAHQVFLPGNLADAYTILGDKDRAFYWLEQAYLHREMVGIDGGVFFLGSEPMYDPLRSDPRFKDLLRRVGLLQ